MTLLVNLFGGPGTGKSTTAAGVFSKLKIDGVEAELVTEFAKDKVWEESFAVLENQFYITAKQFHRIFRLLNKVDVIVTDSPFILGIVYQRDRNLPYEKFVLSEFEKLNTLNIFLKRVKPYHEKGRTQNEEKAIALDTKIKYMLINNDISFIVVKADKSGIAIIKELIQEKLKNELPQM